MAAELDNRIPADYVTPPFPSLYWLVGPEGTIHHQKLLRIRDIWRFTLFWTLITFEAAHLAVAFYAVGVVWWGGHSQRTGLGMARRRDLGVVKESNGDADTDTDAAMGKKNHKGQAGVKNTGISGMWAVPVVYAIIAGVEGVLAGSILGLLLGALYLAGGFDMVTWIPLVWSLVALLVLIVSSFSIQGGL